MIKSVTVTNPSGKQLRLDLWNPWASGFVVMPIDGLGPVKADINITRLATLDGGFYNSARVGPRNIVMKLKPLAMPTIEHTRRLSYEMFPLKKYVKLSIETDIRTYNAYGYVESNEPDIFSEDETIQVSLICPKAYLFGGPTDEEEIEQVNFYRVDNILEFPVENLSLTEKLIELGSLDVSLNRVIDYQGDVETGFEIAIRYIGGGSNFDITNVDTGEVMSFNHNVIYFKLGSSPLSAGDVIRASTVKGEKFISVTRNGVTQKVTGALRPESTWLTLRKGVNNIAYSGSSASNMRVEFRYKPLYEGI